VIYLAFYVRDTDVLTGAINFH